MLRKLRLSQKKGFLKKNNKKTKRVDKFFSEWILLTT